MRLRGWIERSGTNTIHAVHPRRTDAGRPNVHTDLAAHVATVLLNVQAYKYSWYDLSRLRVCKLIAVVVDLSLEMDSNDGLAVRYRSFILRWKLVVV